MKEFDSPIFGVSVLLNEQTDKEEYTHLLKLVDRHTVNVFQMLNKILNSENLMLYIMHKGDHQ